MGWCPYPICSAHFDYFHRSFFSIISAITTNHQRTSLQFISQSREGTLHKIFSIMFLHKHFRCLPKTAGTWFLAIKGLGRHLNWIKTHFTGRKKNNVLSLNQGQQGSTYTGQGRVIFGGVSETTNHVFSKVCVKESSCNNNILKRILAR